MGRRIAQAHLGLSFKDMYRIHQMEQQVTWPLSVSIVSNAVLFLSACACPRLCRLISFYILLLAHCVGLDYFSVCMASPSSSLCTSTRNEQSHACVNIYKDIIYNCFLDVHWRSSRTSKRNISRETTIGGITSVAYLRLPDYRSHLVIRNWSIYRRQSCSTL